MIEKRNPPASIAQGRNAKGKYDALVDAALAAAGEWVVDTDPGPPDSQWGNTRTMIRSGILKRLMAVEIRREDGDLYLRVTSKGSE